MTRLVFALAGIVLAMPAYAQSSGGVAPGTMTPPVPGSIPSPKAAIAGSSAVGEASRDPGLAATERASSAQQTTTPAPVPDQSPPPATQPNKNYAGNTVKPAGDH